MKLTLIDPESSPLGMAMKPAKPYFVPHNQRAYVWGSLIAQPNASEEVDGEVTVFLRDLLSSYDEYCNLLARRQGTGTPDAVNEVSYFIGTTMFVETADTFVVIDGQQRLTTVFILFATIMAFLKALDPSKNPNRAVLVQLDDMNEPRGLNISSHDEDYNDFLRSLSEPCWARLADYSTAASPTSTLQALQGAAACCRDVLSERFSANPSGLESFYIFLLKQVALIRLKADTMAAGFTVFERLNYRGKPLTSVELAKNYFLSLCAEPAQGSQVLQAWTLMQQKAADYPNKTKGPSKDESFLRDAVYVGFAPAHGRINETRVFDTIRRVHVRTASDAVHFSQEVLAIARFFFQAQSNAFPHGHSDALKRLRANPKVRNSAVPSLLVCAGRHLGEHASLERLAGEVHRLYVMFAITGLPADHTEVARPLFVAVRGLPYDATTSQVTDVFRGACEAQWPNLHSRALALFGEASIASDQSTGVVLEKGVVKYLLALLEQHIEEQISGSCLDITSLTSNNMSIEHIMPETLTDAGWAAAAAVDGIASKIQRLGNLGLLTKPQNAVCSNKSFEEKQVNYANFPYYLTKLLAQDLRAGQVNAGYARIARDLALTVPNRWTVTEIDERQRTLTVLLRRILA